MKKCKRCGIEFNLNKVPNRYILRNIDKYEYCVECRKFKNCKICGLEFKHHQNTTCSKQCASQLKEISYMESCGSLHNFSGSSKSRMEWEGKIFMEEGITNVFQRESVKEKSKKTLVYKYGVDHISKNEKIKIGKNEKIKEKIKNDPLFYKHIWWEIHNKLIEEIGYDPRLHVLGRASKESLKVFNPIVEWCLFNNIEYEDIYLGINNKNEYFIRDESRIYMYDFVIRSRKIIIEFHGTAFHARNENWISPFINESAIDNIKNRIVKNKTAISNGFKLLEIWSDVDVNININNCIKFIERNL